MAGEQIPAVVELKIPCRPEFVGVARLAMLGVASRMRFSYDDVEDIRLAVGEACTMAVERGAAAQKNDTVITINSEISEGKLSIEVWDEVGPMQETSQASESPEDLDPDEIGRVLMELLVDEFKVEPTPEGTLVRMVKYSG
jgi:serine/threonine-protein kinase RsbW